MGMTSWACAGRCVYTRNVTIPILGANNDHDDEKACGKKSTGLWVEGRNGRRESQRYDGLDRLLCDVLHILPEQLRFVLVQNQRGIVRRPSHIHLHGNRVMPDLNFTMRDQVQVDGSVRNTDEVHGGSPITSADGMIIHQGPSV